MLIPQSKAQILLLIHSADTLHMAHYW